MESLERKIAIISPLNKGISKKEEKRLWILILIITIFIYFPTSAITKEKKNQKISSEVKVHKNKKEGFYKGMVNERSHNSPLSEDTLGINISNNVSINLGMSPNIEHFPPNPSVGFPGYYIDNTNFNPSLVLRVYSNCPTGYVVTAQASGNFSSTVLANQLYVAPAGTPQTSDGVSTVPSPWQALSTTSPITVASSPKPTSPYWANEDLNYEFQLQSDDTAIPSGATITITYTISAP